MTDQKYPAVSHPQAQETPIESLVRLARTILQLDTARANAQALVAQLEASNGQLRDALTKAERERDDARAGLVKATDDDVLVDIVQEALADLGVSTRLDTGESMRGFCNSVSSQIIDAMRAHFDDARRALAAAGMREAVGDE